MSSPFYIGQPGESYIIELNRLHGVATAQKGTPDPRGRRDQRVLQDLLGLKGTPVRGSP